MNSPVDKIKEHLSIIDVISSYITVDPSGKNFKARCPFHNEKTPSFFISPDRNSYYCFGCGAKGDIFSFVEKFEGTDFRGALKLLAHKAGIPLEYKPNQADDKKEVWYRILEEATIFFEHSFHATPEARAYLLSRGLSDQTMTLFRIGYAPAGWRSASDYLLKKGYQKEDIEKVGLIKTSHDGFYDRFRSRIMFPIQDSSGRVIAFSGRIFGEGETKEAKYINSPDTPLFNKSNVLYGIDKAKSAIRTRGYSILVEGQMDLILSHQVGFTNTVAVSGTALTDSLISPDEPSGTESRINNLGLIRRLSPNIILAYDGDEAGIRAINRSAIIALSLEMQVKIIALPEGKDPADIIGENSHAWKEYIQQAVNIVSFHLKRICEESIDMRIRGKKIRETLFPFMHMIKSSIERSSYISDIVQKTGLPERAVIEDFETYERTLLPDRVIETSPRTAQNVYSRKEYLERRLFGIIFWLENKKEVYSSVDIYINLFKNEINVETYEHMYENYKQYYEPLAFEAEMWYSSKTDTLDRDVQEMVLNLEEEIIQERKNALHPLDTEEKIKEFTMLSQRIESIKHKRFL